MTDRQNTLFSSSFFFFFFFLPFSFGQQQQQPLSSSIELAALFSLRSSLGLRSRDWPRKADPCSVWVGIRCQGGRVVSLNLSGFRRTRLGRLNPQFSVAGLANLTLLATFNSTGFSLPGSIPDLFGRLNSLSVLDLRFSSIFGPIPSSLGNLSNLTHLYLSGNALSGNIPQTLGQLSNLLVLELSQNFLSGPIPPSLGSLFNLTSLHLSNNNLTSSVPTQLANLSLLRDLDLSFNLLSGPLPPIVFSTLQHLQSLVLTHNSFDSALPDSLWSRSELQFLDASYNNLTGTLPNLTSIPNATAAIFNLSHNLLYGSLTSQLESFVFIDFSDNYFQGRVPDGTSFNASVNDNCLQNVSNQRSLQDCQSFYAARGLIFQGFGPAINTTPPPAPAEKSSSHLRFILAGVFGGLGFILLLVLLVVLFLRRREGQTADQTEISANPVPSGGGPPPSGISINLSSLGEAFTYEQLLRATADFGDSNLIKQGHSGVLYRGMLEGGIPIVVKRIDVRTTKRDAHMKELDLFSKASHSRIVPLLGHCLEHENEKLLVYKYMPNGDLSNALYRKTSREEDVLLSLDWITRLKIAIGAAEALSYLHHECTPPIVHRDVQASSILLDDKFEVRLGSLSEVCTQEGDSHQNVLTRFLRLSQTSEQGLSGSPSATCAYDVYCLGKVLLELVSGKLGISGSSDESTNEWLEYALPYINIYEKELVTKIVDPSLIIDEDLLEEVWAMAIVAKSCLNPKPSKRPLTRYILKALENPLKVVREESSSSARLRTTSSRGSWNAALFGSWRQSSSETVAVVPPTILKRSGTAHSQGSLQGSGGGDVSSSHRRVSKEIFPEPAVSPDIERLEDYED
ncbi:putative LRR receptor-like serine/threonine-protein kinase At2g16250 [Tasmannia lanceolata]|uniref:putative LRR receptor-like serine/threonine-protein kinase At2g16250 n=1 Tax=Tasmannia lanceolata TaxID=3420 RepID=UPI004062B5B0